MRNVLGAFADAAILFPLLAVISGLEGFSAWIPMATAGLIYIAAGFFFRVPMAVQPLKSIVIAGVADGEGEPGAVGEVAGMAAQVREVRRQGHAATRRPVTVRVPGRGADVLDARRPGYRRQNFQRHI